MGYLHIVFKLHFHLDPADDEPFRPFRLAVRATFMQAYTGYSGCSGRSANSGRKGVRVLAWEMILRGRSG
jgi:hypothetical protein